jgi:ArsR family transcriptional regulator
LSIERHQTVSERLTDVFRALGDPVRAGVMARIVGVDELACTSLEHALPVSKSTISYHVKILYHAGLINVRKEGRNYFYSARRDAINDVLPGLLERLMELPVEDPTPA